MKKAFIVASCIELAMGIVEMCNYEFSKKRSVLWVFLFIYFINMLMNKYVKAEKISCVIVFILGILLYANTGINTGIKASVYVMALKGIDSKKLLKCFLWTLLTMVIVIIIGALFFGYGDIFFWIRKENGRVSKICVCLGFCNPNRLQILIYAILSYFLFLYRKTIRGLGLVIIMIAYFFMAYLTDCKTGMLLGVFLFMTVLIIGRIQADNLVDILMILFLIGLGSMMIISFLAVENTEKGFLMNCINEVISGRIDQLGEYTSKEFYNLPYMENWCLFSNRNNRNGYDMGYIYIFYYYGIVIAAVYLIFIVSAVEKARRRKDTLGIVLIAGLCIYLFMETGYYSNYLTRDFLLITSAVVWWGKYEDAISVGV